MTRYTFLPPQPFEIPAELRPALQQLANNTHPALLAVPCPECPALENELCHGRRAERNGKPWRRETCHPGRLLALCEARQIAKPADLWRLLTS